jgi:hypothetical protein
MFIDVTEMINIDIMQRRAMFNISKCGSYVLDTDNDYYSMNTVAMTNL